MPLSPNASDGDQVYVKDAKPSTGPVSTWKVFICRGVKAVTIEPVMFLHAASMMMMFVIAQSLKMYKICRGTFGHDIDVCRNLTSNRVLEKEVQQVASDYGMYWALIQTVPSLIFILFLGPWSDRHGRKLPMVLPLIGAVLSSIVFILSAQFEELPPEFLLVGPAFAGLSGGIMAMVMAVFSYITDVSDKESRTIRIAFVYGVWFLGSPAGSIVGGILMRNYGYTTVFSVATGILIFSIIYLIVRLKDSPLPPQDDTWVSKGFFKDMFDLKNVTDSFRTCTKKRPANKRLHLWLLMLSLCGLFLPVTGEGNVRYLYARLKFSWDELMFSYYTATILSVGAFGCIVILPILTKLVGISDLLMTVIAIFAKICVESVTAFSHVEWMMFAAAAPLLYECSGPPMRSLMTKCVESNEVGKIFSMLSVIESGIPILSGVMYSQIYKFTITIFPGTVFMASAVIYAVVLVVMIWLNQDLKAQESDNEKDVEIQDKNVQNGMHKSANIYSGSRHREISPDSKNYTKSDANEMKPDESEKKPDKRETTKF